MLALALRTAASTAGTALDDGVASVQRVNDRAEFMAARSDDRVEVVVPVGIGLVVGVGCWGWMLGSGVGVGRWVA